MPEYLISFNGEWVPNYTAEEMAARSRAVRTLREDMKRAGVYVFLGGLDTTAPVFTVDTSTGQPLFTDGPFTESKEHLGGFTVIDVNDDVQARIWAGRVATACGWPQEVRAFQAPGNDPQQR